MDLTYLSIRQLHAALLQKKITAQQLVGEHIKRIRTLDPQIQAFLTICEDEAMNKAKEIDTQIRENKNIGLLAGIPYSAKDVFLTKGIRTTASSKILDTFIPPYSSTVVEILDREGAILIGKTNNDAFGFGSSTENSDYQVTKNPWDTSKVSGGSSGGSAAAVAAAFGVFSLAEDTGGSIRQPASFCGVAGIKVTYGRVSRYGVIAYGSSLDTIGVLGKRVEDVAIVLEHIAGKDPKDATTLPDTSIHYTVNISDTVKKIKLGVPKEYFIEGMDKEVEAAVREAINQYKEMGVQVDEVSLPFTKYAIPAYYLSGISEVSANLSRYDGIRFGFRAKGVNSIEEVYLKSREEGFGDEVKRRIMLGTYALSAGYYDAFYKKAQQVRTLIKKDFEEVFQKVDMLIAPVSPFPAFAIGEKANDPLQMWLSDVFTVTTNPAGVPSLAIPCGFTRNHLPIGFQLIGPQLSESQLFRVGYAYEQVTNWHEQKPFQKV